MIEAFLRQHVEHASDAADADAQLVALVNDGVEPLVEVEPAMEPVPVEAPAPGPSAIPPLHLSV